MKWIKNNIKYILFLVFKIKIILYSNIFSLKNKNFVMFNNIYD